MKIVVHVDPELSELVPGYLDNRRHDVSALETAVTAGDFSLIEHLAHIMKGTGGGYGFDAITEIGARMEMAAKNKNKEEIQKEVSELSIYLEQVEVVYES